MRISRIYQSAPLAPHTEVALNERNVQYLVNVLRLKPNDEFCLFNGEGGEYRCQLIAQDKKRYHAKLIDYSSGIPESTCQITLGQAISRSDHMDMAIQKAVELGVFAIQPLMTKHMAIKLDAKNLTKKQQHWQGIVISACEQSGRCFVPTVYPALELSKWVAQCQQNLRFVLHPGVTSNIKSTTESTIHSIALLIGPEGGLHDKEVALAESCHFRPWCLGPRILRTETAAFAALALLQQQFGDL